MADLSDDSELLSSDDYLKASQAVIPPLSRSHALTALATTLVVVLAAGMLAVALRHADHTARQPNAQLADLIESASNSLSHTASIEFSMTTTVSAHGQEQTLLMSGTSSSHNRDSSMTSSGAGIKQRGLSVDGVTYFRLPGNLRLDDRKRWLAVRTPKPTPQMRQLAASGPTGLLSALNNTGAPVKNEGTRSVGNIQTTKYSFRTDGLKLFGSLFQQIYGRGWTARLRTVGFDNMPVSIWIDRTGFARRIDLSLQIDGVSIHEAELITPSDTVLHLTAPPASQVHMVDTLRQYGKVVQLAAIAQAYK